ncbi:MAG: methionine synthase [Cyanobacteria bacterium P01_F01_bin.33]
MTHPFLQLLQHRVVVFDGAMGTSLQTQNLTAEDFGGPDLEGCNEYLVLSKPEAVKTVHANFLAAGADVIETDTFGGTSIVLAEYDLGDRAYELNRRAAELAKDVARAYSTGARPRFVAGSMGPGTKLPTLGHISYDALRSAYIEQAEGLIDGGVDLLLLETCQDVLQVKAGLSAIEAAFANRDRRLPLMVSVTVEQQGTMLVGSEIGAALTILEPYPIDILGLNCATGPDLMTEHIRYLSENSPFYISCIPNAGLPENVGGHAHYHLSPEDLQVHLQRFVEDFGVSVVGGCCGTRPDHIRALAEVVQPLRPKPRQARLAPSAASIYSPQPYDQDNSFLIVGERLNASGSKKCREMLQAEDWDGLVSLGRSQEKEGAHILDVNVDYVGRDGQRDMHDLVSRLVSNIRIPLMLDSTEWEKMEAGLKVAGGKCLLNSTNYEDGEPRFLKVLELARTYGAGIVVGTIDEDGMARTADQKFAIAQRAYRAALEFDIPAHELFFDPLALPISTGIEEDRVNGKATIESIRRIRAELPGCHIILGVSNVSFGLNPAARQVLNSVFLHEAVAAGMDSAIVSARKILPLAKIDPEHQTICRQLIYDERQFDGDICTFDPLATLTQLFEGVSTKRDRAVDDTLPLEDKLKRHIIDGERIGLEKVLQQALEKYPPLDIVNTYLLDGMKVVGELFGSGQMQLPFVLQSAETMKAAVAFLEPYMDKIAGSTKGKVLIATVKGDVHDIGKNLVDIILTNNGYTVYNLGIKQPVDAIIQAYREHQADCIAMSGLLVKSTAFMKQNLEVFNEQGISAPVILGGAALTRKFVEKDCQAVYQGRVIYGRDAFTDLHFMDQLMSAKAEAQWDDIRGFLADEGTASEAETKTNGAIAPATNGKAPPPERQQPIEVPTIDTRRSEAIAVDIERPTPPFWGATVLTAADIPWQEVFYYIDRQALFAGQWQIRKPRNQSKEEFDAFVRATIEPVLVHWQERIVNEQLLKPTIAYGYFPCLADGNRVFVYDPESFAELTPISDRPGSFTAPAGKRLTLSDPEPTAEIFEFPRQRSLRRLCISDFYVPRDSALNSDRHVDIFPMQAVTVGPEATEFSQALFASDRYTDYLYFYGLSVTLAEALAEWAHARIRRELGFGAEDSADIRRILHQGYRGSRYSFGYPACPHIPDQRKLLRLLQGDRIGLSMDESDQLDPEQSTTAIVAYHPEARYFSA